jgi:hypothetical protein
VIVAISGIRDLAAASIPVVEDAVRRAASGVTAMRFGGALGVDTVALAAVGMMPVHKTVIVPYRLVDQPRAAATVVRRCADSIIELHLPRSRAAYLRRNDALLDGADRLDRAHRLLAFTDGRETGGTCYTIHAAKNRNIEVVVVVVLGQVVR